MTVYIKFNKTQDIVGDEYLFHDVTEFYLKKGYICMIFIDNGISAYLKDDVESFLCE